jgi:5-methylcytosine-specific restriction endonuclease McrA
MPFRPPIHKPVAWRPPGAARAPKRNEYYHTPEWRALRLVVLKRDGYRCQLNLPGCEGRASVPHHLVPRKWGGGDHPGNLVSVCKACHNRAHPEKGAMRG